VRAFSPCRPPAPLPAFPTRRSSDLRRLRGALRPGLPHPRRRPQPRRGPVRTRTADGQLRRRRDRRGRRATHPDRSPETRRNPVMSFITAHALYSTVGTPAADLEVTLYDGAEVIASARTDDNGRVSDFGPDHLDPGDYRIVFGTGAYFAAREMDHFHPSVTIDFTVQAGQKHYHIPLLLSPFAYSTYRGS